MKELILYVANCCKDDAKFGARKLNKILFYSDFLCYLAFGKAITDQEYFAIKEGPAPRRLVPIREELRLNGDIEIQKVECFRYFQDRVVALRESDLSVFEAEEIKIVDLVIENLKNLNGRDVSERSHEFVGWKAAIARGEKTTIPYSTVRFDVDGFWGLETPELTEELLEHGRSLAGVAA